MVKIDKIIVKDIVAQLLNGKDYRSTVVNLINAEFLQFVLDFFKKIVEAKLKNKSVTIDWYKAELLNQNLPTDDLIINAGLNKKTITNMRNSARREIVLDTVNEHYDKLYETIKKLVEEGTDVDIKLTLKMNGVSVDLNMSESLIVINTLAVKRAELRGGAWSTAGKQVEKVLMLVLCKLFSVPNTNYKMTGVSSENREVDFFLVNDKDYLCEVKLMGKGNPESADAIFARNTDIFIADKLSDLNKLQLNSHGTDWVELRSADGYQKFSSILSKLGIPHTPFNGDLATRLPDIFDSL
jgi:sugar-specific transcriptional regulator TrmB